MKDRPTPDPFRNRKPFGARRRTAGGIVPLTLAALVATTAGLPGEILDDFNDPAWSDSAWTTQCLLVHGSLSKSKNMIMIKKMAAHFTENNETPFS